MGRIISLAEAQRMEPSQEREWVYNALDATGTREIADVLLPRLNPAQARTYAFERSLQTPALAMGMRGVLVDTELRGQMVAELRRELKKEITKVGKIKEINEVWDGEVLNTGWCPVRLGKHHRWPRGVPDGPDRRCMDCGASRVVPVAFEPGSTHQVKHLLYDLLKVPPQFNKEKKLSANDDVLERIGRKYKQYHHITEAIRSVRDLVKQLGALNAKLTPDARYPSTFNVGAAWTGRFSSSQSPYKQGGNLQNVAERHRRVFIADPGFDLAYLDLKQAESNVVAHLSGDEAYIEAHKSGDVHTYVTRLMWPDMPWTWDIWKDKKIAKQSPEWDTAPGHDFRYQSKRIQHGSNFGMTPTGIALVAHIPLVNARASQRSYFRVFSGIRAWQNKERVAISNHETLTNVLGREVILMGRPWDEHTVRQGFSFKPQSSVADILDLAMWRVWYEMDPTALELLAQVHDALLLQFPKGRLDILKRAISLMQIPIEVNGRTMQIEVEAAVGKNWGHKNKDNPDGIEEIEL